VNEETEKLICLADELLESFFQYIEKGNKYSSEKGLGLAITEDINSAIAHMRELE